MGTFRPLRRQWCSSRGQGASVQLTWAMEASSLISPLSRPLLQRHPLPQLFSRKCLLRCHHCLLALQTCCGWARTAWTSWFVESNCFTALRPCDGPLMLGAGRDFAAFVRHAPVRFHCHEAVADASRAAGHCCCHASRDRARHALCEPVLRSQACRPRGPSHGCVCRLLPLHCGRHRF